jgi:hypothetical protein
MSTWLSAINHYTGHGVPLRIVKINPLSLNVTDDKLQGLHAEMMMKMMKMMMIMMWN